MGDKYISHPVKLNERFDCPLGRAKNTRKVQKVKRYKMKPIRVPLVTCDTTAAMNLHHGSYDSGCSKLPHFVGAAHVKPGLSGLPIPRGESHSQPNIDLM